MNHLRILHKKSRRFSADFKTRLKFNDDTPPGLKIAEGWGPRSCLKDHLNFRIINQIWLESLNHPPRFNGIQYFIHGCLFSIVDMITTIVETSEEVNPFSPYLRELLVLGKSSGIPLSLRG
jgi:hypothetical protein